MKKVNKAQAALSEEIKPETDKETKQDTKKPKNKVGIKNVIKILRYSKKQNLSLFIYAALTIATSVASLLYPIIEKIVYSHVENKEYELFLRAFIVYFSLSFVINVVQNITNLIINKSTRKVWKAIVQDTFARIFPMALTKLDKENTGKLYNRVVNDPGNLRSVYYEIVDKFSGLINRIGYVIIIFSYKWQIALYACFANLIIYALQQWRIRESIKNQKAQHKISDERSGIGKETFSGIRDAKCLDMQDQIEQKYIDSIDKSNKKAIEYFNKSTIISVIITFVSCLTWVGFGYISYYYLKAGEITFAVFIILWSYSSSIRALVDRILNIIEYLREKEVVAQRVMEVFDETIYPQDKFGITTLNNVQGKLKIQNLDFAYNDSTQLFKDLNVEFEPNKLTAIVGKSGEGKSTISNLLFHLYDWQAGTITLDGVDIRELDRKSLKNNLAVIPQSPYIFNMSLKENLLLVKPTATDEEMKECLESAQLKEFVETLPNGIDTLLGENGVQMSGGQKQRLAIARALLKNSKVIIFDEATSSLDNQSQAAIQKIMENLKGNHTLIVIAHRLSTIKNSDKIVVLNDHKVAAEGTHEELISICDVYKDLYIGEQV